MAWEIKGHKRLASRAQSNSDRLVYSVPEAGRLLGLGRNAAYEAARRGDIPTIRMGRLLRVPKGPFHKLVGVEPSPRADDRRAELVAMARMAVRLRVPIESLSSLRALLNPDLVEKVIDAYWQKNGEEPKTATIDLGKTLLRMARETGCLDQLALDRLDEIRVALEQHRREGLTPKNLQLVRQVLTDGVWSEVVSLPNLLMQQARLAKDHAPRKAAIAAQLAAAIAILTFAPVRLGNLIKIELGQNLIKPGGPNTPYWLVFPNYDVKNRVDLNFKFDQPLTDLLDEYVHEFRPTLPRGANTDWLFPGEASQHKHKLLFSEQITVRVQKASGLRLTVHQFRHAAAAVYLKHRPGDYETVRRLLGHRDIQTTTRFYCGLQTMEATE